MFSPLSSKTLRIVSNVEDVIVNSEIITNKDLIVGDTTENFSLTGWQ